MGYYDEEIPRLDKLLEEKGMIPVSRLINGNVPLERFMRHTGIHTDEHLKEWILKKNREYACMMARHQLGESKLEDDMIEFVRGKASAFAEMASNVRQVAEKKEKEDG